MRKVLEARGLIVSMGVVIAVSMLVLASSAGAAQLVEFGRFGSESGGAAGHIEEGSGVAVNATGAGGVEPGEVYVADTSNQRVDQFTKEGAFVRAWGGDVNATEPGTGFETCTAASGDTCQVGTTSGEAGAFQYLRGIAVDQQTGNVYVLGGNNHRVDVFTSEGEFEGAFGFGVNATAPAAELQFCTVATGCKEGEATVAAGGFQQIYNGAIAIDPGSGDVWVGDVENHRVNEFSISLNGSKEVTRASFMRAIGWNVDARAPAEELQECTTLTGCQEGSAGAGDGQISNPVGLAVDSADDLYVSSSGGCSLTVPCRVMKFNPDGTFKENFGPSSGGVAKCQLNWSGDAYATEHSVTSIAIEPTDQHVFVTVKTSTTTYEICEFNSDGILLSRSSAEPAVSFANAGVPSLTLALGPEQRFYVLGPNTTQTSWPVTIYGVVPAAPAELLPVTELTATTATLNGEVTTPQPGGVGFDVNYRFEYSGDNGTTWLRAPSVGSASIGSSVPGLHAVQQKISTLLPNTTYRVRLVTVTSSTTTSEEQVFKTPLGAPQITEIRARGAGQSSVTLEAHINPNGSTANYRVEWGPTTTYGHVVPAEFEPPLGSGHEASLVTANLTGLTAGSTYHYRVVASNAGGTTTSPDEILETVNSCGLPEGRCFELVSPRDAGPVALPGEAAGSIEMHFQAAPEPGGLAYVVETGFPESTKGAEVVYQAKRGADGWASTQLSPAITALNEGNSGSSASSQFQLLSENLSCGIVASNQPLTSDPSTRLAVEAGGANLYRRNSDGSYTAITSLAPENPEVGEGVPFMFNSHGMSHNCGTVLFSTEYRYPVDGASSSNLYEWTEGTLRSVGFVPGASGEVAVEATASESAMANVVSADGSRIFFSATRQTSTDPEEIGKTGVFVREGGTVTHDLSLSETAIPDKGATFQAATRDGSRVFFTANAGLTDESSAEGTDLYEYNLESKKLTDLSVDENGEAAVTGFIGASEDGSHAYFIARGQLVPGRGRSYGENETDKTYSVYGEQNGEVSYVGPIYEGFPRVTDQGVHFDEAQFRNVIVGSIQTSRVSPDGRYLLFESGADVTGYNSGDGVPEAYLYDASATAEPVVCISCRQNGSASVSPPRNTRLEYAKSADPAQTLVERDGKPQVYFSSFDPLASSASEGQANIYEWSHGQVFRIATEPPGLQPALEENGLPTVTFFIGANADGTDLYFGTPQTLNWEDGDERASVYDARIGGGFPEPATPLAPCNATSEGSCQAGSSQTGLAVPAAATTTFIGPGNVTTSNAPGKVLPKTAKKQKKPRKKPKKHQKKQGKSRRSHDKKGNGGKRPTNSNRRAGK